MIKPLENEDRKEYLARVTIWFLLNTIACEQTADYDEATCDGHCLANDIAIEYNFDTDEIEAL